MLLSCGVEEDSFFFFNFIFKLYIIVLVLPNIKMNPPQVYMCSLSCKEIQPVHPKGDWFWVFIARTDAEAETTVLWPPDAKS